MPMDMKHTANRYSSKLGMRVSALGMRVSAFDSSHRGALHRIPLIHDGGRESKSSNAADSITKSIMGFTLIEVVMALLLIAILAAIAVPSYRGAMQTMRVSALSNDFISALAFTRAEAIKRNTPVAMCAAADSSFSSCGANTSWANGWIIFVDPNADGVIDSTGTILKTHDALLTGSTIITTMGFIVYNRSGFLGSNAGTLTLTVPGCTGNSAVLITLSLTGWASVTSTACTMA